MTSPDRWRRVARYAAPPAVFLAVFLGATAVPLKPQGWDTVPGRLAMVTLACDDTSNAAGIEWVARRAAAGDKPPYLLVSSSGEQLVSLFGPGPGYLGSVFARGLEKGSTVTDRQLMSRARRAAALAVALSAALLVIALLARVSIAWAALGGLCAAASCAGIPVLAQGLWQQSSALPLLMAALAAAAWTRRVPLLLVAATACAVLAATLRPPDAPLCAAVILFGLLQARRGDARAHVLLAAGVAGLAAALPVASWNYWYFDSIWPQGQLAATAPGRDSVFVFELSHAGESLLALLFSPGRGVVWFAPIFVLGCVWRDRAQAILPLGILAQLIIASFFYKWWGGITFGPRLLALSIWVATFAAVTALHEDRLVLLAVALSITALVGVAGAARYDPRDWELREDPDQNPGRLWQIADSPLTALVSPGDRSVGFRDAPPGPFVYCEETPAGHPQRVLSSAPEAR